MLGADDERVNVNGEGRSRSGIRSARRAGASSARSLHLRRNGGGLARGDLLGRRSGGAVLIEVRLASHSSRSRRSAAASRSRSTARCPARGRLAAADVAFVGGSPTSGRPQTDGVVYRSVVDQRVKGSIGHRWRRTRRRGSSTRRTSLCPRRGARGAGTAHDGVVETESWLPDGSRRLLSTSDEPRGDAIQIVLGLAILVGLCSLLDPAGDGASSRDEVAPRMSFDREFSSSAPARWGPGSLRSSPPRDARFFLHDAMPGAQGVSRRCAGASRSSTKRAVRRSTTVLPAVTAVGRSAQRIPPIEATVENAEAKKSCSGRPTRPCRRSRPRVEHVLDPDKRARGRDVASPSRGVGMHSSSPTDARARRGLRQGRTSDETARRSSASRDLGRACGGERLPRFVLSGSSCCSSTRRRFA